MARKSQKFDNFEETSTRRPRTKAKEKQNGYKLDSFELINFKAMNENQDKMISDFKDGYNILSIGSAGTGKTVVALYLALERLINNGIEKIIIVRSATSIRPQGFLPGTLEEKEEVYTLPYKQLVNFLFHNDTAWEVLTKRGYIQFVTTSYIRGLTFEKSIIVFDELQNTDVSECYTLLTRLGKDCRIIVCGDFKQNDIKRRRENSSFNWIVDLISMLPDYFKIVEFGHEDIVRSELVKQVIIAAEKLDDI